MLHLEFELAKHADGELTLVSETKAIDSAPDLAAWGAFISIGHPIGERSLLADFSRVPPASILTYDCARRQLSIRRYWDWPEPSDVSARPPHLEVDRRLCERQQGCDVAILGGGQAS